MNLLCKLRSGRPDLHPKTSLVESAKALIRILDEVDQFPALYLNQKVIREAIQRYEHKWIPLLASVSPEKRLFLVPPLDVEWVWFCHMLCPVKYVADSAAIWNAINPNERSVVDHKILSRWERRQGIKKAKKLWSAMFPNEQFHILEHLKDAPLRESEAEKERVAIESGAGPVSRITYDIVAAAERQITFHYQVAYLPQYKDDKFLNHGAERYLRMFLKLHSRFPGEVRTPTNDIDLMRHVHMMHPIWYKGCTEKLRGSVLPHDDTLDGHSEGPELSIRRNFTTEKWKTLFQEPIFCDGAMWRGNIDAEETMARNKINELVNGVENIGRNILKSRELFTNSPREQKGLCNVPLKVFYGGNIRWENTAQRWVHMTDYRRSNANLSPGDDDVNNIERLTFLHHKHSSIMLKCRTIHYMMRDKQGEADGFRTLLEVFSIKSNMPIATAHNALEHSLCEAGSKASEACKRLPAELMMVLRVSGADFGLLGGKWVGSDKPMTRNSTMRGRRESVGYLSLRLYQREMGKKFSRIQHEANEDDKKSSRYSFELPVFKNGKMVKMCRNSFDLSDGTVIVGDPTQIVTTYLICMTAAALHVYLQLRFEPDNGTDAEESMYPAWSKSQIQRMVMR